MDYKNPFLMGLCAPIYLAAATVAITKDFLMAIMLILGTLEILGAYIVEFPIFQHYIKIKCYTRLLYPLCLVCA